MTTHLLWCPDCKALTPSKKETLSVEGKTVLVERCVHCDFVKWKSDRRGFYDRILGMCRFRFFYLTNDLYGGYSYECERGFGSVDYVDPESVLKVAKEAGFKDIHLAGDIWKLVGRRGWGEVVSLEEAEKLIRKLKKVRYK